MHRRFHILIHLQLLVQNDFPQALENTLSPLYVNSETEEQMERLNVQ